MSIVMHRDTLGLWATTIQERRQRIADLAKCVDCGSDQAFCRTFRKDGPGPEGLCCWSGRHEHRPDQRLLDELLREVAAGEVRTVEEVYSAPVLGPDRPGVHWLLWQDTWWYPHRRPAVRIAEMEKPHRLNTANWLERRATLYANAEYHYMIFSPMQPGGDMACDAFDRELQMMLDEPVEWLRGTPLMQTLRRGLPTRGRKLEALRVRAVHWHTCPMRLRPERRPRGPHDSDPVCVCVIEDGRTIGATNDPKTVTA
jgi:hypothetical protein